MAALKEILETIAPAERCIYTGKVKPRKYFTFQTILNQTALSADDEEKLGQSTYRVTFYSKDDYEADLEKTIKALKAAGYYIQSSNEGESYETDTGYWLVPITIQLLKE
ncbi:MAG: hypothetical protein EOM40_10080 [Clostridia bacterium]|nr:hypothetical protein [Clostridia bacterium]